MRTLSLVLAAVVFAACSSETEARNDAGDGSGGDAGSTGSSSGAFPNDATDAQTPADAAAAVDAADAALPPPPGTPISTYGCVCDGVSNDSACLQQALDGWATWTNRTLEWPTAARCVAANLRWSAPDGEASAPYVLRGHGSTLRAPDGHPVRATAPWDPILRIEGGSHYVLDDLDFDGNRDTRVLRESPSHNLLIMSSRDVLIQNMSSIGSVTDGLYIASSLGDQLESRPQRVTVLNPIIRDAFRNNISVINCVDCTIRGDGAGAESTCQLTGAHGTPPQAGIDFEPNAPNAAPAIQNAVLDGCYISKNDGTGILLHTAALSVGVAIRNNTVEGDRKTFRPTCGAAMHMGFDQAIIEDNVFRNYVIDQQCRALFDWGASSNPHVTVFRNNRIENIRYDAAATRLFRIHPANSGGHTITNNTLVDIGRAPDAGGWCLDTSSRPSTIRDNSVDGVLQSPNPGCP